MQFNLNDDRQLDDVDAQTLQKELAGMQADDFAVLSQAEEVYVQCYCEEEDCFVLEYRAGDYLHHFAADSDDIPLSDIQAAFLGFLQGDESWKDRWDWERIEFDEDFQGD